MDPIYLDYNATTPILPAVLEGMLPFLRDEFGNPSSGHSFGRRAKEAVERARVEVAELLGADAAEIVFTSGGTEANNLALFGAREAWDEGRVGLGAVAAVGAVVTSAIEHPAVRRPCERLAARGAARLHVLSVDARGVIDVARAEETLARLDAGTPALVSVMHANNETGALQPVREISRLARARGATVHTDAAQSAGKVPVDVGDLDVDLLSIAGHKLYAPKGVGALYLRRGTHLVPHALGAGHERGLRPGTENVASIVGLGAACAIARREGAAEAERVRALRDRLWGLLAAAAVERNGPALDATLPNTLSVRFVGARGSAVLALAPEIAASTGSACHDGGESPSGVLLAMGLGEEAALATVRITLGRGTTLDDVDRAAACLIRAHKAALMR
jgi:cysteine desulfurase